MVNENKTLQFRERFPIFKNKIFLNSCSKGALSHAVEKAYEEYLNDWRNGGSPWELWVSKLEEARTVFAEIIGAKPDEVTVTTSASAATRSR